MFYNSCKKWWPEVIIVRPPEKNITYEKDTSKSMKLCWHYDHSKGRNVKRFNIINWTLRKSFYFTREGEQRMRYWGKRGFRLLQVSRAGLCPSDSRRRKTPLPLFASGLTPILHTDKTETFA